MAITEPKPGIYVFAFDQNIVGCCRFTFRGKAGETIELQHGECATRTGRSLWASSRWSVSAMQLDCYTFRSDGVGPSLPRRLAEHGKGCQQGSHRHGVFGIRFPVLTAEMAGGHRRNHGRRNPLEIPGGGWTKAAFAKAYIDAEADKDRVSAVLRSAFDVWSSPRAPTQREHDRAFRGRSPKFASASPDRIYLVGMPRLLPGSAIGADGTTMPTKTAS